MLCGAHAVNSEACCKHVVQIAKGELQTNPQASRGMEALAGVREADAEVGCRNVLVRYGLTTPLAISNVDLSGGDGQNKKWLCFLT